MKAADRVEHSPLWRSVAAPVACLALVVSGVSACGSSHRAAPTKPTASTTASTTSSTTSATSGPSTTLGTPSSPLPKLVFEQLASGLIKPVDVAVRHDDPNLYVAEQTGRILAIRNGGAASTPVLDLRGQVALTGETGLLGLTFSPAGDMLYIDYNDKQLATHIVEYRFDGTRADISSRRELLKVAQPYPNHKGGEVTFGPDGFLYIGFGDGGSAGDPQNRAQNPGEYLGKILRIDPTPNGANPYRIPPGNPFIGRSGAHPEIWAFGVRNPWRFSFDRVTAEQWVGDVGQDAWEEIDHVAAGRSGVNYGWSQREGLHSFKGGIPAGAVDPVFEYGHNRGCAVIGGYVYRGSAIKGLNGAYFFGDSCQPDLRVLVPAGNGSVREVNPKLSLGNVSSFGEDQGGELLVLSLAGQVMRVKAG